MNCVLPVTKTDNLPNTPGNNVAVAGSQVTYTITIFNPTGAPGSSIPAQTVSDTIPAPTTFVSAVSSGGGVCGGVLPGASGVLGCITNLVNPSTTITVVVDVPLSAAGTTGICDSAQVQGGLSQVATDCIDVAPSNVTIAKVADAATYKAGDPISWTITINSTGPSPATGVSVSDTATDGFDITGSSVSSGACVAGATTLTTASFTGGTMNSGASCVLKVTGTVHTPNPTDLSCNNSASVSWTNAGTAATAASTSCLSKDAQMVKDTDGNLDEDNELANLWLCKTPAMTLCTTNGQGFLDITENVLNVSGDPQGVGAFEFQLKYDNHIFDISIAATNWLYSTGRIPGAAGSVVARRRSSRRTTSASAA